MNISEQQKQILEVAIALPGPFKPNDIAHKLQSPRDTVAQQLRRMVEKKIVIKDDDTKTYAVSEDARKEWAKPEKPPAATIPTPNTEQTASTTPQEGAKADEEPTKTALTEESAGLSPYQHFRTLGLKIGVAANIVDVVTDHVFNGGKYTDIKWVYRGLSEMAIRDDILKRWAGSWRSYLQKSMPVEQIEELKKQAAELDSEMKAAESGKGAGDKDFIVEDGQVEYVGPGVGIFTADQAIKVAAITRRKTPAVDALASLQKPMTPTELLEFFTKLQTMQKTSAGTDQAPPSSFVVTLNPDGTSNIKEYKTREPIVISPNQPAPQPQTFAVMPDGEVQTLAPGQPIVVKQPSAQTFAVTPDGEVQTLAPGQPIVVKQPAPQQPQIFIMQPDGTIIEGKPGQPIVLKQPPPAEQGSRVILVKPTGELVEWDPKKPIVITREEPKGDFPMPISVVDEKGNPMRMDLNALITWKRFESEEKRADERAKTLKELVTTVRTELPTMLKAAMMAFGSRSQPSGAQPAPGAAAAQGTQPSLKCSKCGAVIGIKEGEPLPDTFPCPNCGAPVATKPGAVSG
jgi:predicted RNA-binding Zn-ribbon protein involved in translation (DUF1610 family)